MRAPYKYQKAVKNKELTSDLLESSLRSLSKYIYLEKKTIREAKTRYNNRFTDNNLTMSSIISHNKKKDKYEKMKIKLLEKANFIGIKRKVQDFALETVFEGDEGFDKINPNNIFYEGSQFNGYFDVLYRVVRNPDRPLYKYYLTYEVNGHEFYSLILHDEVKNYEGANFVTVDELDDEFDPDFDPLSIAFIEKVCEMV